MGANCRYGLAMAVFVLTAAGLVSAAPQKRADRQPQALIAGTVFQDNGRLLRGAIVTVVSESDSKKKREARSDQRGEFAIRVPPGPSRYRVTASAKGFLPQEKTVEIQEHERVRTTFLLSPR